MPDNPSSEIYRRLNAVERAIEGHLGACGEMNKARERWERKTDSNLNALGSRVGKLERSEARLMGVLAGVTSLGGVLGAVLGNLLTKYLGG